MHSHATLEFKINDFSLLCDPWIDGLAFFGAWRHYPQPQISSKDLSPNAIFISHEHSDHFHPQTLSNFAKDTPIYIPQFVNQRLEKRLDLLGFTNIISLPFGQSVQINKDIQITLYEPISLWNDSQILIDIAGFKILNINDAGINHSIASKVGSIDCVCAAFSPGASGYPATFTHLSLDEKICFYQKSRVSLLDMLLEACKMYNARYFLPFASHFVLNHPKHLKYMKMLRKNTIFDCVEKIENPNIKVIDLLAGDSWDVGSDEIIKIPRTQDLYTQEHIEEYIQNQFRQDEFLSFYPNKHKYRFDRKKCLQYFENLNFVPEISLCENLSVSVYPDFENTNAFSFVVDNGVKILDSLIENPNLSIKIPSEILMYIVVHNESWDEATIGYWCEFSRNPDVYHAEFWRLLQAPFYLKHSSIGKYESTLITPSTPLCFILENLGEVGSKILARYGLYCLSCSKLPMESLQNAIQAHGISTVRSQRLLKELNIHFISKSLETKSLMH